MAIQNSIMTNSSAFTALRTLNDINKNLDVAQNRISTEELSDVKEEGLGSIVDADLARESARLTALQVQQQLSVQSLGIANQRPQSLLGLFR